MPERKYKTSAVSHTKKKKLSESSEELGKQLWHQLYSEAHTPESGSISHTPESGSISHTREWFYLHERDTDYNKSES